MTIPEERRAVQYLICSAEALNLALLDGQITEDDLDHLLNGLDEISSAYNAVDPLLCLRYKVDWHGVAEVTSRRFVSRLDPGCPNMPIFRRDEL